jgi:dTDP-4-amino-4,6-dideoxygalactose transaminase
MHDIAAGIGLVQLERLQQTRARRDQVAAAYNDAFDQLEWALPLFEKEHATHARYNYTIRVPSKHRDAIIEHLAEHGVSASVHYMPLYKHPVFEGPEPWLPTTEKVWKQILTLPMSSTFSDEEVAQVIKAVRSYADGRSIREPTLTEADWAGELDE